MVVVVEEGEEKEVGAICQFFFGLASNKPCFSATKDQKAARLAHQSFHFLLPESSFLFFLFFNLFGEVEALSLALLTEERVHLFQLPQDSNVQGRVAVDVSGP